jgi:hypothetical protein
MNVTLIDKMMEAQGMRQTYNRNRGPGFFGVLCLALLIVGIFIAAGSFDKVMFSIDPKGCQ